MENLFLGKQRIFWSKQIWLILSRSGRLLNSTYGLSFPANWTLLCEEFKVWKQIFYVKLRLAKYRMHSLKDKKIAMQWIKNHQNQSRSWGENPLQKIDLSADGRCTTANVNLHVIFWFLRTEVGMYATSVAVKFVNWFAADSIAAYLSGHTGQ